jgi:required for meiotic nuclear division protein 1
MKEAPQTFDTVITPVSLDTPTVALRASQYDSQLDLELLQKDFLPLQILSADPLIVKLAGNAHIVVLRFGAVIFWQCSEEVIGSFLRTVERLPGTKSRGCKVQDKLLIRVGRDEDKVNFKDVWLKSLTLEHIKMISEIFGQSVALEQCEMSVHQAIANSGPVVDSLKTRGQVSGSTKQILKTAGFAMAVRETILAKLTLFDDPSEAWESERFSRLHNLLYDHFDIKKRLSGLHAKLTFLTDLNSMLMNVLQHQGSHRLEWIVIFLIVIEVVFSFIEFFR